MKRTFAIIGANLAGGRAALTLRDEGFDGRIVLIGDELHPPYERPPLSKDLLTGDRDPASTYLHTADYYSAAGIDLLLGTRVTRVTPRWTSLEFADGTNLSVDRVLMATGAHVRRLTVPGAELAGVHYLRTLDDALEIRDQMNSQTRLTVVGAGFIGAEVAASARLVGCEVHLLEVADLPLGRVLADEVGRFYLREHRARGVEVRTGTTVTAFEGDGGRVRRVLTADGSVIDTDLVVIGVGTVPAAGLAQTAGIASSDGILVDESCRTSMPNVYAAGDVCRHPNRFVGGLVRLEHWQAAQDQAVVAARAMMDRAARYDEVPWFWSDQYDLNLQLAGHPAAGEITVQRGDADDLSFSVFYLRNSTVVGTVAVNRPRDVHSAIKLIRTGVPVLPEQIADPAVDLRALAKAAAVQRKDRRG